MEITFVFYIIFAVTMISLNLFLAELCFEQAVETKTLNPFIGFVANVFSAAANIYLLVHISIIFLL